MRVRLWLPPTLDVLDGPPAAEPDPLVRVPGVEADRAGQAGAAVGEHGAVRQPVLVGAGTG